MTDTRGIVSIALTTTLLLATSASQANVIVNPSFEDDNDIVSVPTGWTVDSDPDFGSGVCGPTVGCPSRFVSDGLYGGRVHSRTSGTFAIGDFESLKQDVDLTDVTEIRFDVKLSEGSNTGNFDHFKGVFLVDGVPLWEEATGGIYLNRSVDVSGLSGVRTIELRNESLVNATLGFESHWAEWDNLRAIPEPATLALGSVGFLMMLRRRRGTPAPARA